MIFGLKNRKTKIFELSASELRINSGWYVHFEVTINDSPQLLSIWSETKLEGALWLLNSFNLDDSKEIIKNEHSIDIPFDLLMNCLSGQESYVRQILNLPELFDGGIHLESQGLIHSDEYSLHYKWVHGNGRTITLSKRSGGFLYVGSKKYLLPFHAWKLAESLDSIRSLIASSESTRSKLEQLAQFQILKTLLPGSERTKFSESSEISNLKLFYANAFRLETIPDEDDYKIRPVLLRKTSSDNSSLDTFETVLPPNEQSRYADNFNTSGSLLPYYNIGVGKYIVTGDQLNKALNVVHKIQSSKIEDRLTFLKNPKALLQETLEGIIDEDELNHIFSDRVIGIGEWQAKVIPWLQIKPNEWIPSGEYPNAPKGIDVDGIKIELSHDETEFLIEQINCALKTHQPFIEFKGVQIPALLGTIEALTQIRVNKTAESQREIQLDSDSEGLEINKPPIMLVKENLETLDYVVERTPRVKYPNTKGVPSNVKTVPKSYQLNGFNWLCQNYIQGSRGVLLADDMGLGKTFQSLMFFSWLKEGIESGDLPEKPLLIVAPTGLLKNWEAEMDFHLVNGLGNLVRAYATGIKFIQNGRHLNTIRLKNAGVVLTTYETLNRYQISFGTVRFSAVIFDEMQKLKNPGIKIYSAAESLNCDFWIGMTGTPVENRLCDLWSIAEILQPGMLGSIKEFSHHYEKVVLDSEATAISRNTELRQKLVEPKYNAPSFMLRRMKDQELDGLPSKYVHEYPEDMPLVQSQAYDRIIKNYKNSNNRKGAMLEAIQGLRAVSLHPDYKRQEQYKNDEDFINCSARLRACFRILDEVHLKKEKALIFVEYSEWHKPDFLSAIIQNRYGLDELPMVINGEVNSQSRQSRVTKFQSSRCCFDVMLLSPRAGGVGLTLTAANHVIHLTRWWNPAVEDQATDRIYRIGQQLPVHVYYPMAIHPIDRKCFDFNLNLLLKEKRKRSSDLLMPVSNSEAILEELMTETFHLHKEFQFTLSESYSLSNTAFESFVLTRLERYASSMGVHVRIAPESWSNGSNLIVETLDGQVIAFIQCKHVTSNHQEVHFKPDLEKVLADFGVDPIFKDTWCIGITNSNVISSQDSEWLRNSETNLIFSGQECLQPEVFYKQLNV